MGLLGGKLSHLQEQVLEKKRVSNEAIQEIEQKVASLKEKVDQCTAQVLLIMHYYCFIIDISLSPAGSGTEANC